MNTTDRDTSIETLRAIAVMMMVAFHVISNPLFDNQGIAWSVCRHLIYSFGFLHVPLFAMISGYVYALRPVQAGGLLRFCKVKLRRLYLPMLTVGLFEILMRSFVPGVQMSGSREDLWRLAFIGYTHFWFLLALLVLMVLVAFLDSRGCMQTPFRWFVFFLASIAANLWLPRPEFLCLGGVLFIAPCLVLGVGLRRFDQLLLNLRLVQIASLAFVAVFAFQQWITLSGTELAAPTQSLPILIMQLTGNALLIRFRFSTRFLGWLGGFAYSIYLFHAFGMGIGNRAATLLFGNTPVYLILLFSMALTLGLLLPVVAQLVIVRKRWSRFLFLGMT